MKINSKISMYFALVASMTLTTACGTADIRVDSIKNGEINPADRAKGLALLNKVYDAAGGLERYKSFGSVQVKFRDDWSKAPAPARWLFMEYEKHNQLTKLDALVNAMGNSRMEYLEGPQKGHVWGVRDGRFWLQKNAAGSPVYKFDMGKQLFVENVEFYLGFPFYLNSADQVLYLDQVSFEKRPHHRVFLSWKTFKPQKDLDQWIIWIDADTNRISQMKFTVRKSASFITGVYYVDEYKTVQGLTIPVKLSARFNAKDPDPVHTYHFQEVRFFKDKRLNEILPAASAAHR